MTALLKPVSRRADAALVRESGRLRRLCITLYPNGTVGLRQERSRREELVTIAAVYDLAVRLRVRTEQADKKKAKKGRRK